MLNARKRRGGLHGAHECVALIGLDTNDGAGAGRRRRLVADMLRRGQRSLADIAVTIRPTAQFKIMPKQLVPTDSRRLRQSSSRDRERPRRNDNTTPSAAETTGVLSRLPSIGPVSMMMTSKSPATESRSVRRSDPRKASGPSRMSLPTGSALRSGTPSDTTESSPLPERIASFRPGRSMRPS